MTLLHTFQPAKSVATERLLRERSNMHTHTHIKTLPFFAGSHFREARVKMFEQKVHTLHSFRFVRDFIGSDIAWIYKSHRARILSN